MSAFSILILLIYWFTSIIFLEWYKMFCYQVKINLCSFGKKFESLRSFLTQHFFHIGSCYAIFKEWLLPGLSTIQLINITFFATKNFFETLTYNLGCFPLDYESYHPQSECFFNNYSILSLVPQSKDWRSTFVRFSCFTPIIICIKLYTLIYFAEYQLSPSLTSLSLLLTTHLRLFQQTRVRSSNKIFFHFQSGHQ